MSSDDFELRLLDPLLERDRIHVAHVYDDDGSFSIPMTLTGAIDEFSILPNSPYPDCTDGDGHIMSLSSSTRDGASLQFENEISIVYHVAVSYVERPVGITINPRDGLPQYVGIKEDIGVKQEPDSVVDNGNGTITFTINSACESGVDHSGGSVLVYLKIPGSLGTSEAIALETLTSSYSAPNNSITTVAGLGQSTISTIPSDYYVVFLGPMIRRNTDLSVVDDIFYVGTVTGGGAGSLPSSFDTTNQRLISATLSTLNDALDEFASVRESVTAAAGGCRKDMPTARSGHAYVRSSNGQIYVFGGWTSFLSAHTDSGEAHDRAGIRAVEIGDTIYVMGGFEVGNQTTALVQRYKPATDSWDSPAADLISGQYTGAVGVIGGKIYYACGQSSSGVGTDAVQEYDPDLDTWTAKTPLTPSRNANFQGYAVANGKLYLFGGRDDLGNDLDTIDSYDPSTDSWDNVGLFPTHWEEPFADLNRISCVEVNRVIHGFGGSQGTTGSTDSNLHFMFNPNTNVFQWVSNGSFGKRSDMAAVNVDGIIHLIGGHTDHTEIGANKVLDGHFCYDARTVRRATSPGVASTTGRFLEPTDAGGWIGTTEGDSPIKSMPVATMNHRVATFEDAIHIVGGQQLSTDPTSDHWRYFPATNTWDKMPSLPSARSRGELVASVQERKLFYVMGHDGATAVDDIYEFPMRGTSWTLRAHTPEPRHSFACEIQGRIIHMVGGYDAAGVRSDEYHFLHIGNDSAEQGTSLSIPWAAMSELIILEEEKPDAQGGVSNTGNFSMLFVNGDRNGINTNLAQEYFPLIDSWEDRVNQPQSVMYSSAVLLYHEERKPFHFLRRNRNWLLLYCGGENFAGSTQSDDTDIEDLVNDSNPASATLTAAIAKHRLGVLDSVAFVFGGTTDSGLTGLVDTVEKLPYAPGLAPETGLVTNYSETEIGFKDYNVVATSQSRDTVAFDNGDIYGQGSWSYVFHNKIVKIGEDQ
jgi:N-acetylneuraminic acid mutarotase